MVDESTLNRDFPSKRRELAETLTVWLSNSEWNEPELRNLLKGYSLPSLGGDEEPYSWIVRGLEDLTPELTWEMANRVSLFLRTIPPEHFIQESDDAKFLYNLFNLSAGLNFKNDLASPLKAVVAYFRAEENAGVRQTVFQEKRFYDIESALREAIIVNQDDKTFFPIWQNSLQHGGLAGVESRLEFLGSANPFTAFRGVVLMANFDQPCIDEIGWALKMMADILALDTNRASKFQQLLDRVRQVWSQFPVWNKTFIELAVAHRWNKWVAELYPFSLAMVRDDGYDVVGTFRESLVQLEQESIFMKDFSFHVHPSPKVNDFVDLILSRFAKTHSHAPSTSYRSAYVELIQEIFNMMDDPHLADLREAIRKAYINMNEFIFPNNTRYRTAK